jgi:hypothetical protein
MGIIPSASGSPCPVVAITRSWFCHDATTGVTADTTAAITADATASAAAETQETVMSNLVLPNNRTTAEQLQLCGMERESVRAASAAAAQLYRGLGGCAALGIGRGAPLPCRQNKPA